jgi:hypothetical protein
MPPLFWWIVPLAVIFGALGGTMIPLMRGCWE